MEIGSKFPLFGELDPKISDIEIGFLFGYLKIHTFDFLIPKWELHVNFLKKKIIFLINLNP